MRLHEYVQNPPCCCQDKVICYHETCEAQKETRTILPPDIRLDTTYLDPPDLIPTAPASTAQRIDINSHSHKKEGTKELESNHSLIRTPSLSSSEDDTSDSLRESDKAKLMKFEGSRWQCQACQSSTARKIDIQRHVDQVHFKMWAKACKLCGKRRARWEMCCSRRRRMWNERELAILKKRRIDKVEFPISRNLRSS